VFKWIIYTQVFRGFLSFRLVGNKTSAEVMHTSLFEQSQLQQRSFKTFPIDLKLWKHKFLIWY